MICISAAKRAQLARRPGRDVVAVEDHATKGRVEQSKHQPAERALAAAALADQAHRFPPAHAYRHSIDGSNEAIGAPEEAGDQREVLRDAVGRDESGQTRGALAPASRGLPSSAKDGSCASVTAIPRRRASSASCAPAPPAASSGSSTRQRSMRIEHRSAKRQPAGNRRKSGTIPSIACSRRVRRARPAAARSRAARACTDGPAGEKVPHGASPRPARRT